MKYLSFLFKHLAAGLILFVPVSAYSEAAYNEAPAKITFESITIESNSFEIDNKDGKIIFTGDVVARSDNFTLTCQEALLFFHKKTEQTDSNKMDNRLNKVIATGNIIINQPDEGRMFMGENAVYYKESEKIILTGKPVIKQGGNSIEGSIITYFLAEDRFSVEGTQDGRAIITGFPDQDKR